MKRVLRKVMKQFHYGEKGFTLIELLVVIAILGVLAAVVVPNVSRFMGRGRTEAARTELHNVQTAVTAMMADQTPALTVVAETPAGANQMTNNMLIFPTGNVLYGGSVNYIQKATTQFYYHVFADGTVQGAFDSGNATPIN